ncbi:MAG: hypothetical protein RQ968_01445 [Thermoproteota archaeon]|jgi:hypothetical protein|nr:hypothetical protein [Thermoproteota archaeon]
MVISKLTKKFEGFNKFYNNLVKIISNILPYTIAVLIILYLAGFIFIITQNPLPYIAQQNQPISIFYPRGSSQQTILEGFAIFFILVILFSSLLIMYQTATKKYYTTSPVIVLSLALFIFFVLFLVLITILTSKFSV